MFHALSEPNGHSPRCFGQLGEAEAQTQLWVPRGAGAGCCHPSPSWHKRHSRLPVPGFPKRFRRKGSATGSVLGMEVQHNGLIQRQQHPLTCRKQLSEARDGEGKPPGVPQRNPEGAAQRVPSQQLPLARRCRTRCCSPT